MQPKAFLLISLVENNQHHCSLLWLLIGLLPDLSNWSLGGTVADTLTLEKKGRPVYNSSPSARNAGKWGNESSSPSGYPDMHLLFQTRRGRSVSWRLSVPHELIAAKSNSQSTHWANWVPVFVWDTGEVILPSQLQGILDAAWFQILWWACVLFALCNVQSTRRGRHRLQLTGGNCSHLILIGRLCV